MLVDPDLKRAEALGQSLGGVAATATDYREVLAAVQGAIIAVPHHLHYPIAADCLRSRVAVLCEKPLTETAQQAKDLVALADGNGVALLVNNMRRRYPSLVDITRLLRAGELGTLRDIQIAWGEKFDWNAASGFYFARAGAGRGALLDRGAHMLDLLCWWMGGLPRLVACEDDSFGGSEAVVSVQVEKDGVSGRMDLSWLSRYSNDIRITGSAGRIELGVYDWRSYTLALAGRAPRVVKLPAPGPTPRDVARDMIDNFIAVLRGQAAPHVSGRDVIDAIALTEMCYAARTRFALPWHDAWTRVTHAR